MGIPTIEERNEFYTPPTFDMTGGTLGQTPILWELRMAYEWTEQFEEEEPDWDQCCTCWEFAMSQREAEQNVWSRFKPPCVKPVQIASCFPKRFRNQQDDERDAKFARTKEAE